MLNSTHSTSNSLSGRLKELTKQKKKKKQLMLIAKRGHSRLRALSIRGLVKVKTGFHSGSRNDSFDCRHLFDTIVIIEPTDKE